MSGPKTFPADSISKEENVKFGDRLSVAAEGATYCFVVSVLWAFFQLSITSMDGLLPKLALLSAPLIATGVITLIGGAVPGLVQGFTLKPPLNLTIPFLWVLVAYLSVVLMTTQESTTTQAPEGLRVVFAWAHPGNFLPVMGLQITLISIVVAMRRTK